MALRVSSIEIQFGGTTFNFNLLTGKANKIKNRS